MSKSADPTLGIPARTHMVMIPMKNILLLFIIRISFQKNFFIKIDEY
jgi:hypothetical protein